MSNDPETTHRPSGNTATLMTYNEDPDHKSSPTSGRRAPHVTRVPLQRPQQGELRRVHVLSFAPPLLLGGLGFGAASSLRLGGRGGFALLFLLGGLGCCRNAASSLRLGGRGGFALLFLLGGLGFCRGATSSFRLGGLCFGGEALPPLLGGLRFGSASLLSRCRYRFVFFLLFVLLDDRGATRDDRRAGCERPLDVLRRGAARSDYS